MTQPSIQNSTIPRLWYKTILAAVVGLTLFVNHDVHPFIPSFSSGKSSHWIWIGIGLFCCLLVFHCGSTIFRIAWRALTLNETNKNTLIALGALILLAYSCLRIIFPYYIAPLFIENYFCNALIVIALANFSLILEYLAKRSNQFFLQHLRSLLPKVTTVITAGQENVVSVASIQPGDIIKANIGDTIVADGIVVSGESKLDQQRLNSAAEPRIKKTNDFIYAGATNKTAPITYKAVYCGKQSTIAHIIDMVQTALLSKSQSSRFMEIFTTIYITVVLLIATVVMLFLYMFGPAPQYVHAMLRVVTILVGVSPTAFALSIPLPLSMGISKTAQYGILFRNAKTLIKASRVNTIIFDKAGILTDGKPQLMKVYSKSNWQDDQIVQYAASIEARYEHPLANAIVDAAFERNIDLLPVENFMTETGLGVSGLINGQTIIVGNVKYMRQQNINVEGLEDTAQRVGQQGFNTLILAVDNKAIALLSLQDPMRKEVRDAIRRINKLGVKTMMFTADHRHSAEDFARKAGINTVVASITSEGKLKEIDKLQHQGEIVALVADGVTNAPALSRADIGVAVATSQHLIAESANVNLLRDSLHSLADTVKISRATRNKMKQNIIISSLYNFFIIVVAAGATYPLLHNNLLPLEAMMLTTVCTLGVILNSTRLRYFKPFQREKN
jgi:Cu+-exporting ATPase